MSSATFLLLAQFWKEGAPRIRCYRKIPPSVFQYNFPSYRILWFSPRRHCWQPFHRQRRFLLTLYMLALCALASKSHVPDRDKSIPAPRLRVFLSLLLLRSYIG